MSEDDYLRLSVHLDMFMRWADRVPQELEFHFVQWTPVIIVPRIEALTRAEAGIAYFLSPLHSQLSAITIQILWKTDQIVRSLCTALNERQLIVAAGMARSLIESSSAFCVEAHQIMTLWRTRKLEPASDAESLAQFESAVLERVGQILFGTKIKVKDEPATGIERTNILTLLKAATKLSEQPWIPKIYELLCDTVHPSIGSNRCFWVDEGVEDQPNVYTYRADRHATRILGDLPFAIGMGSLWSLVWLGQTWVQFELLLKDVCLTAKIFELVSEGFGIVHPTQADDYCSCGAGRLSKDCPHQFAELAAA